MYLFIINKKSGNGHGLRTWNKVQPLLHSRKIKYQHIFTENSIQAKHMLSELLQPSTRWLAVVIIGGDGTIHSTLPILQKTGIPLAVIPAGSGNDTARNFGIPLDTDQALEIILNGKVQTVDLISTSGVLILTALAIGFDAKVAQNVNRSWYKKWCNLFRVGRLAYIIGILHTMLTYKPSKVSVTCDQSTTTYENTWMTAISNGVSYGGGLMISPNALPNDGQLDVCIVHGCSRMQLLRLFPSVINGKHVHLPCVTMLRGTSISFQSEHSRLALGDGENLPNRPHDSIVFPSSLQIMTP
ncbi:diacylglycerol/lipid kinase family protein [Paenibacillus sp. CMAA1364]